MSLSVLRSPFFLSPFRRGFSLLRSSEFFPSVRSGPTLHSSAEVSTCLGDVDLLKSLCGHVRSFGMMADMKHRLDVAYAKDEVLKSEISDFRLLWQERRSLVFIGDSLSALSAKSVAAYDYLKKNGLRIYERETKRFLKGMNSSKVVFSRFWGSLLPFRLFVGNSVTRLTRSSVVSNAVKQISLLSKTTKENAATRELHKLFSQLERDSAFDLYSKRTLQEMLRGREESSKNKSKDDPSQEFCTALQIIPLRTDWRSRLSRSVDLGVRRFQSSRSPSVVLSRALLLSLVDLSRAATKWAFPESEQSRVLRDLSEKESQFNLVYFMRFLEKVMIPKVLGSFLSGDTAFLQKVCSVPAFHALSSDIYMRNSEGKRVDSRVLNIQQLQFYTGKYINGIPSLLVTFGSQHVNWIKDANGKTLEGGPEDIRLHMYVWAVRQNPAVSFPQWELLEMFQQANTKHY